MYIEELHAMYYVRRKVGAEVPDPKCYDLYKRLREGDIVSVESTHGIYANKVYYKKLGEEKGDLMDDKHFLIYFREPTEDEVALILLAEV